MAMEMWSLALFRYEGSLQNLRTVVHYADSMLPLKPGFATEMRDGAVPPQCAVHLGTSISPDAMPSPTVSRIFRVAEESAEPLAERFHAVLPRRVHLPLEVRHQVEHPDEDGEVIATVAVGPACLSQELLPEIITLY